MSGNVGIFVDLILLALLLIGLVLGWRQGFVQALTRIIVVVAALLLASLVFYGWGMHVLGTLNGIRVRWSMRVLRWVKQSLCSLSVLNVGWEDGEGEGAELLEGICWCYANRV